MPKVNFSKSHMFVSNNIGDIYAGSLAQLAGIPLTKNLERYLGVPSIHGRVLKGTFLATLERIKARLEGWKVEQLSLASREVSDGAINS